MKKVILYIFGLLLFASCEEVVTLDLQKLDRQLVVEANLYNPMGNAEIVISYSQNFYDTVSVDMEDQAVVSISSPSTGKITLVQIKQGMYYGLGIPMHANEEYSLSIDMNDRQILATTKVPEKVDIFQSIPVANPFLGKDSLNLFVTYFDPVGEDDYFRVKVNKLGATPTSEYYVVDDSFGKDGLLSSPVYYKNFAVGDTVIVELFHITRAMYNYYAGLSENVGGSFNSIAPGNPVSNLPDGVMGYFTAFGYDADTIIMTPVHK